MYICVRLPSAPHGDAVLPPQTHKLISLPPVVLGEVNGAPRLPCGFWDRLWVFGEMKGASISPAALGSLSFLEYIGIR